MTALKRTAASAGAKKITPVRDPKIVDANPEKQFFIAMLVRDIELVPSIVDLVDNSIDSAKEVLSSFAGKKPKIRIEITANDKRFEITDNCGGIDSRLAQQYAFRFGRPSEHKGVEDAIGQFGIGMKRSLFKLGQHFIVESSTKSSSFVLDVDVAKWAEDSSSNWTFKFKNVSYTKNSSSRSHGTYVLVDELHKSVADDLGTIETINRLRAEISTRHAPALNDGVSISVNGQDLVGHVPALLASNLIAPIATEFLFNFPEGDVGVSLYAGIAPSKERDSEKDDGNAESFKDAGDAGWYIYCNGRLVIAADKSELTGWSQPVAAAYHPQYRDFRGYVFLNATESSLLPWDTTKTSLDRDSQVFRALQGKMFNALQQVQTVLNRVKGEKAGGVKGGAISTALKSTTPIELKRLNLSPIFVAPVAPKKVKSQTVSVQFNLNNTIANQLQEYFNVRSAREAARLAVERFVQTELDQ
ncbi:MAG TPA: ATP-binding protein [archaeon]|nr:ATP-binding protein [archaeon]